MWAAAQVGILLFVLMGNLPILGGSLEILAGPGLLLGGGGLAAVSECCSYAIRTELNRFRTVRGVAGEAVNSDVRKAPSTYLLYTYLGGGGEGVPMAMRVIVSDRWPRIPSTCRDAAICRVFTGQAALDF